MKVSILIPLYNAERYIAQTIESALNQTWNEKEVIIVDDGSTDQSLSIAHRYESEHVKIFRQSNQGVCAARNFALTKAEGEYIQYLDHDDIMDSDKIEKQMNFIIFNKLEKKDVVYSAHLNFMDDISTILPYDDSQQGKSYDNPLELFNDMLIARTIILPGSYLMHRSLIERVGGWNEELRNNEDGEFYARIMTKAKSVHFVDGPKLYWRATPDSLSKQVTESYLRYKYVAWTTIVSILLTHNHSQRTQYACSQLIMDFIVEFRPANQKWLRPLEQFMKENNIPFDTTNKSALHQFLIRNWGWRYTLLFKEKIKHLKNKLSLFNITSS